MSTRPIQSSTSSAHENTSSYYTDNTDHFDGYNPTREIADIATSPNYKIAYSRVSTQCQKLENQLQFLQAKFGLEERNLYTDVCSGTTPYTKRPGLSAAINTLRHDDVFIVYSLDRIGRNVHEVTGLVHTIVEDRKSTLVLVREGLVIKPGINNSTTKLILGVLAILAEFEVDLIRERRALGIERARKDGKYKGRIESLTPEQQQEAVAMVQSGVPKAKVARQFKVSRNTMIRYCKNAENSHCNDTSMPVTS